MANNLILICPIRPDLDCIGGSLAYAAFRRREGIDARIWIGGQPDGEAQYYLRRYADNFAPLIADDTTAQNADAYALVDLSVASILPGFVDCAKVTNVIDHRFLHDPHHDFPNATVQLEAVGAAATLIAELFMQNNIAPTPDIAGALHGAIWSNNLAFTSSLTTDRDRAAFAWMEQYLDAPSQTLIDGQVKARLDDIMADLPGALALETKLYELPRLTYRFAQFELIGVGDLWRDHGATIRTALDADKTPAMLNLIDLQGGTSLLYTADATLAVALADIHDVTFTNGTATLPQARLRKQIAADLAAKFS